MSEWTKVKKKLKTSYEVNFNDWWMETKDWVVRIEIYFISSVVSIAKPGYENFIIKLQCGLSRENLLCKNK